MVLIAQIGNFEHSWCSEVHWGRELRGLGHQVEQFQEPRYFKDQRDFIRQVDAWCFTNRPDLVVYTRTFGLPLETTSVWRRIEWMGAITCSYHLDLYVGLGRESDIGDDPFWTTQYVFTADGDPKSEAVFRERGVNHRWLSPAVVSDECVQGAWREDFEVDVAFVGSRSYLAEWPWRPRLIGYLEERFGARFRQFNKDKPEGPVRGLDLNDLFASAKVVIGDTLHQFGHTRYWSDRYFETIGRGGFLLAPYVEGIEEFLTPGEHFASYRHPGTSLTTDEALTRVGDSVDYWLGHPVEREAVRVAGQEHVRNHHTYRHRWNEALAIMGLTTRSARATTLSVRSRVVEKLELGSGYHPTRGFTHLDLNPDAPDVDIVGSAWPLELADASVNEIRAVDVLEHLSYWDTPAVLADWFRVLTPGGKLYVQVPDASQIMRWYIDEPNRLLQGIPVTLPQTPLAGAAWRLLGGHNDGVYVKDGQDFRLNAHYVLFSPDSLRAAMETAGFVVDNIEINPHPNLLCYVTKPAPVVRRPIAARVVTPPRIGLIARNEIARGLALMTKGFYDHMPVTKVLLAKTPHKDCALGDDWYPGATEVEVRPGYRLDEAIVREWLDGLDVVYTAETPYDWRMPQWCREAGVKLVVHGMPEFVRHGQPDAPAMDHPDEWWWPTSWRLEHLPPGPVVPVPMPNHEPTAAPVDESPLRIYHIIGKRAAGDRNGTDIFLDALRSIDTNIHVTLYGLEGSVPQFTNPPKLKMTIDNVGPADRWELHQGHHLLVLPRRYAGLCLPSLEAASRGVAVMMPDVSPNQELASVLVPSSPGRLMRVPCGRIPTALVGFGGLAHEINRLNNNRDRLRDAQKKAYDMVARWDEYRDIYLDHFQRVCNTEGGLAG